MVVKVNVFNEKQSAISKLRKLVNNRVVGIVLGGKSIEGLEKDILKIKDYDICWCGINLFEPVGEFILSKINKKFDIIFNCYTLSIANDKKLEYEKKHRIPRLTKFMKEHSKGLILSTWRLMGSNYGAMGLSNFYNKNKEQILLIDYLFDTLTGVNSGALLLATMGITNPKKIIVFGLDGCKGNSLDAMGAYYKKDLQIEEKRRAYDVPDNKQVISPTTSSSISMEKTFMPMYKDYCGRCGIKNPPEIINCSIGSIHNIFRKINYDKLKEELT